MRLTIILLTAAIFNVSANGFSQTISFNGKNASLREVITAIKKQTDYAVIYNSDLLNEARPVSLNVTNLPLRDFLQQVFKDQPLDFSIKNTTIILSRKVAPPATPAPKKEEDSPPSSPVQGRVTGSDGLPLHGATITLKGRRSSTFTNAIGVFSLTVTEGDVLMISYVGYQSKEIRITNASLSGEIRIVLAPSNGQLDQLQVIAYGTTTQRLNVGNVSTVKSEDIEKQPVTNVLTALAGRVPGLFITQNSGLPNSSVSVQIRGVNSIGQGTSPLYIIDGVPYNAEMLRNVGQGGSGDSNPFSFINPASIESVDVLKDGDATAIYGSRAANGVILITTKKGKPGPVKFDVNVYTGLSETPPERNLMNLTQYLAVRNEAFRNTGAIKTVSNAPDLISWDTTRNIDWQKRLLGKVIQNTDAQISMSGGDANTSYRIYGGYNINKPPFPVISGNYNSNKISAGLALSSLSPNKRILADVSVNYLVDNTFLPSYDPTPNVTLAPDSPEPFNPDGSINYKNYSTGNPFAGFYNTYKGKTSNLTTSAALTYKILAPLTFKVTGGYNTSVVNGAYAYTIATQVGNPYITNPTGSASFSFNTIASWIAEPQLSYNGFLGKGRLNTLLGTTFQNTSTVGQQVLGAGYTNDALLGALAGATSVYNGTSTNELYRFTSLYGRISYNWEGKYLLNLTARRDGSSRFGPGRKFGNFGAIGAAWIFSSEKFFREKVRFLSFGKLRGSYGVTGNAPGSNYAYASLNSFITQGRPYQNSIALSPDNLLSTTYAWEQVKKLEGGLELGFWKDRILVSGSYFRNRTSNQLLNYAMPAITGFNSVLLNRQATVQNTGTEFTLTTKNISSRSFTWTTRFNITAYRNKLVAFPGLATSPYSEQLVVGQPITLRFVYQAAGVDPETGVYQFYDAKHNIVATPTTPDYYAKSLTLDPRFYGGIQNSFAYRGFGLDLFFTFVKQLGSNYLLQNTAPGTFNSGNNNLPVELLKDVWHHPKDIAKYQQFTSSTASAAGTAYIYEQYSDAAYTDASYIRLKNVSFSYTFPEKWLKHVKIDQARVFFQAQNLLTITKYKGPDPEGQGLVAPLRVMTFGTALSF
jgi:TonB-linked SusC/RagA family outer membrane protein